MLRMWKLTIVILGLALPGWARSEDAITTDLYAESYTQPVGGSWTHYQRAQGQWSASSLPWGLHPTVFFDHQTAEEVPTNTRLSLGLQSSLQDNLRFHIAAEKNFLENSALSMWQLKVGVTAGNFWQVSSATFLEAYLETFYFQPEKRNGYTTATGWGKYGWRWYEQNHWILDPVVLEARASDNSDHELFGPSYQMLNLGPRASFWWPEPEVGFGVYAAKSWARSQATTQKLSEQWILVTLGARF